MSVIKDNFVYIVALISLLLFGSVMMCVGYDSGLIASCIAGLIGVAGYAKVKSND
jgi:hypothetical protein